MALTHVGKLGFQSKEYVKYRFQLYNTGGKDEKKHLFFQVNSYLSGLYEVQAVLHELRRAKDFSGNIDGDHHSEVIIKNPILKQ
jgi:hypothetical protein